MFIEEFQHITWTLSGVTFAFPYCITILRLDRRVSSSAISIIIKSIYPLQLRVRNSIHWTGLMAIITGVSTQRKREREMETASALNNINFSFIGISTTTTLNACKAY